MEEFRSKSVSRYKEDEENNNNMKELRCYSLSYANETTTTEKATNDAKLKKAKSSSSWGFSDAESQRKRRVASYKVYTVEGKLKGSIRKSLKWFKDRCDKVVHGW